MRQRRLCIDAGSGLRLRMHRWLVIAAAWVLAPAGRRGLGRVIDLLGRLFPPSHRVKVAVFGDRTIRVGLGDGYWLAPLLRDGQYEEELRETLEAVLTPDAMFIDAGANVGYWSVFASTVIEDPTRILAVEASSVVFDDLVENGRINGHAYQPVRAAVWDEDGQQLEFATHPRRHAWSSADPGLQRELREAGFVIERVQTVSIDRLAEPAVSGPLVIKLDVEGAEARALQGAKRALASPETLLIFEAHGRDPRSHVTDELLRQGFELYACERSGGPRRVDAEEADAWRSDPRRGYNLAACRPGGSMSERLQRMTSDPA